MTDVMRTLDDGLAHVRQGEREDAHQARHFRAYRCRCGAPVFFENTRCLTCRSELGYLPDEGRIAALDPAGPGVWRADGRQDLLKPCANRAAATVCNWMVSAENPARSASPAG